VEPHLLPVRKENAEPVWGYSYMSRITGKEDQTNSANRETDGVLFQKEHTKSPQNQQLAFKLINDV
jgi:hypothetical protein